MKKNEERKEEKQSEGGRKRELNLIKTTKK